MDDDLLPKKKTVHEIGQDLSLLSIGELTERIGFTIREKVKPDELGLNSYFNFRSLSEHNELNDPAWA